MKNILLALFSLALLNDAFSQPTKASSFIDSFVAKNNFNGTILIEQKGEVAYRKSFGLANFPFKVHNTTDTRYRIASITKALYSRTNITIV